MRSWWLPVALLAAGGCSDMGDTRHERIHNSPQWREGKFRNTLERIDVIASGSGTWQWLNRNFGDEVRNPRVPPPVLPRVTEDYAHPPGSGLRITWMGHSSMLVEIDGARFLTDPVWGPRASPLSWVGPKRFHDPPMTLTQLPKIDAVVFSHDHYDHLDAPTIRAISTMDTVFLAPLAVGAHLERFGVPPERVVELDWWESREVAGVELVATPARHFSGRSYLFDDQATLWASWVFNGPSHRAYFSGDTAMFPGFSEIGARYGPFDITMIESGAYDRLWADVHIGPEQAVRAHQMLQGRLMMPVHWGTFNLALHSWVEPAERLMLASEAAGVDIVIPKVGQMFEPADAPAVERWWPDDVPWQTKEQAPVVSSGLTTTEQAAVVPSPNLP